MTTTKALANYWIKSSKLEECYMTGELSYEEYTRELSKLTHKTVPCLFQMQMERGEMR